MRAGDTTTKAAASNATQTNYTDSAVALSSSRRFYKVTRTALASLLTRRRYEVKTAASMAEARALAGKHAFDLLISDIGLPDGNGLELMSELRAGNADLQGIALTGYGMEEDLVRSHNAGFATHLIKPVRVQSLEAALATVARNISANSSMQTA